MSSNVFLSCTDVTLSHTDVTLSNESHKLHATYICQRQNCVVEYPSYSMFYVKLNIYIYLFNTGLIVSLSHTYNYGNTKNINIQDNNTTPCVCNM